MRRLSLGILTILGASALGALTLLWAIQDSLVFPGPALSVEEVHARANAAGAVIVEVQTADGERLLGWEEVRRGRGAVVYFHGNASVCDVGDATRAMHEALGTSLYCVAYRGYPGSSGHPSEAGLAEDARAIWRHVLASGVPADRIVLHGRSLGGGVAVSLATEVEAAGLVLESTFRSVRRVAAETYPKWAVDLLLRHPFDSDERIASVDEPTLVLHGDQDTTIPVDHGRWLAAHAPRATYVEAQGHHHNSGLLYRDTQASKAYREALEVWLPHPVEKLEE